MALKKIHEESKDRVTVKVYKDSEWGEFRARLYVDGKLYEPADAFDTDKESILHTAKDMLKREFARSNPREQKYASKAIITKYVGPTASKGARIKVTAEGVPTKFYPFDYDFQDGGQAKAAEKFANERGWIIKGVKLVGGALPDGSIAWVSDSKRSPRTNPRKPVTVKHRGKKFSVITPHGNGFSYVSSKDKIEFAFETAVKYADEFFAKHGKHCAVILANAPSASAKAYYSTRTGLTK